MQGPKPTHAMDFLVIDDDQTFCEATCLLIEGEGHYVESAATPDRALDCLRTGRFDAALLDLHLGRDSGLILLPEIVKLRPNMPVVMFSAEGTVKTAVQALHQGAMDFLEKPFTRDQFNLVLARIRRFTELSHKIERLEEEVRDSQAQSPDALIEFDSPTMRALADEVRRAAKSSAPVLLLGETGTGKSAVARLVHAQSDLAARPFVAVSCLSLSKELLETQLFGHVRGAFVGALKDYWGKVKLADGGTLFLDEIGDLPLEIQAKLLRLIQEHEYERVGESIARCADLRIVAATNRDLKARVATGAFREDLYYRLTAATVIVPPLRARPEDIMGFAAHYLRQTTARTARAITGFTPECAQLLRDYAWPGNLRELHNTIERAAILCSGPLLDVADLPAEVQRPVAPAAYPAIGSKMSLAHMEELHIRHMLAHCENLSEVAHVLGIDQATLYRKRKKMGLGAKGRVKNSRVSLARPPG